MKICVIAPGHDEIDHRVIRATEQLSEVYTDVCVFLEKTRVSKVFQSSSHIKSYEPIALLDLLLLKVKSIDLKLLTKLNESEWVYIHDSGLYGVLLIRFINKCFPGKHVIFDYHDLLEWEFQHHMHKLVSRGVFSNILYKVGMKLIHLCFTLNLRIKAVVGISDGQISKLIKHVKNNKSVKTLSVPNARVRIPSVISNVDFFKSDSLNLIWVGNVGRNRSLEKAIDYAKKINEQVSEVDVKVFIIGKLWGSTKTFNANTVALGKYSSDLDVMSMLPLGRNIGVFFGWRDDYQTGINQIASPNKLYSYINVGMPFLIPSNLTNVIDELGINDKFVYTDDDDFIRKVLHIYRNYPEYIDRVSVLKQTISWDSDIRVKMAKFYKDVAF